MDRTGNTQGEEYAPGHTPSEIERLIDQGRWFGDLTERLFRCLIRHALSVTCGRL
jgi:hypothetical protein